MLNLQMIQNKEQKVNKLGGRVRMKQNGANFNELTIWNLIDYSQNHQSLRVSNGG